MPELAPEPASPLRTVDPASIAVILIFYISVLFRPVRLSRPTMIASMLEATSAGTAPTSTITKVEYFGGMQTLLLLL